MPGERAHSVVSRFGVLGPGGSRRPTGSNAPRMRVQPFVSLGEEVLPPGDLVDRGLYEDEHELLRDTIVGFYATEVSPHHEAWERAGVVDRQMFQAAGRLGLLGFQAPEALGGLGVDDFRFNVLLAEVGLDLALASAVLGLTLHNDICLPYFLRQADSEQQQRWVPSIASGELITAVAMTEPQAGSDLAGITTRARREGDVYVVNGSKTFISNGINADLVVAAVRTGRDDRRGGLSLVVLERGMPGFDRGRNLNKVGLLAQDTAELHFSDVQVPVSNLLGEEGQGFRYLQDNLAQERLSIAASGVAAASAALDVTLDYVQQRTAFGRSISDFQNTQFVLAEVATEIDVTRAYVDRCVLALNAGCLTIAEAAKAKWWATELQVSVIDRCVQLFGGYGYVLEYPIARMFRDARVTKIYGGTTEIMKSIVAKDLGLR